MPTGAARLVKNVKYAISVWLFFSMFLSGELARAESAGELGRHYGVRYTMPVIIGPLRDLRQGKLPPPAALERQETPDAAEGDASAETEAFAAFNPDLDFDEPLYADFTADSLADLYAVLHKRGSRVTYQISPLMKFPLEDVKQRVKAKPAKKAAKESKTAAAGKAKRAPRSTAR
jgi:hypothetical protein